MAAGTWVRVLASLFLIALVLTRIEWTVLLARLGRLQLSTLFAVLAINLSAHVFLIVRWGTAVAALRLRPDRGELARCYWVGNYYNLFLPSSIGGDAARAYRLYQLTNGPLRAATASLLDRFGGLGALLLLGTGACLWLPPDEELQPFRIAVATLLLAFLLGSSILSGRLGRWLRHRLRHRRNLRAAVAGVIFAVRALRRRPSLALAAVVFTACYYGLLAYTHSLLGNDLRAPVRLPTLLVNILLIAVGSLAPISINGIGLRETLYILLFGRAGWSAEAALVTAWVIFACVLASGVPGFLYELRGVRKGQRD